MDAGPQSSRSIKKLIVSKNNNDAEDNSIYAAIDMLFPLL